MLPRKKSGIERFLSLNRHFKRLGGRKHLRDNPDLAAMKARVIDEGPRIPLRHTARNLNRHLGNLRGEFSGHPEPLWHHAKLIVLLRRGFRTESTYAAFRNLWDVEGPFLVERLDLRWLVSAADTFAEHDRDPEVRAAAMMASLFANTVKMHESERYLCDVGSAVPDPGRVERAGREVVPIFGGMSRFMAGTEDTLLNLRWRLEPYFAIHPAGTILKTIWDRRQLTDTENASPQTRRLVG